MKAKTVVLGYSIINTVLFILDTSLLLGAKPSYLEAGTIFSSLGCLGLITYAALDNFDKRLSKLENSKSNTNDFE